MGTVMTFGSGWDGKLGLPTVGMGKDAKAYEPTLIHSLPSDIVNIHIGHYNSYALTSRGQLWLGAATKRPNLVVVFLIGDGALLSCGNNQYGKLGRDGEGSIFLPVEISFRPVHSMTICKLDESNSANVGTTKIASWGWNRHYELGRLGDDMLLGLIDGLDGENPVSISAGLHFSIALTSKGKLWVWGSGLNGTLGFASPRKQLMPYYLFFLHGKVFKERKGAILSFYDSRESRCHTTLIHGKVFKSYRSLLGLPILWC